MSNLQRISVTITMLVSLLLTACGGGGTTDSGGNTAAINDNTFPGGENTPPLVATAIALPATGITTCTDDTDAVIPCAGSGQDGELQSGVAWPNPRFSADNSGNCMIDNLTGLMWSRHNTLYGPWQQVHTLTANLDLCGYTDWRMPNRKELLTLVNYSAENTGIWLSNNGFDFQAETILYSSSSVADSADKVWGLILLPGIMSQVAKSPGVNFLPVRAGKS